ncbi:Low-density lipoprotein receptor [Armadillidium vulgare]|nr:Low-density lipoprotein receptor [Armadillidium vulgare]
MECAPKKFICIPCRCVITPHCQMNMEISKWHTLQLNPSSIHMIHFPLVRFSRSCYLDSDGEVTCNCRRGYHGRRCEQCAQGYEGNPTIPGESCQPVIPDCQYFEFICGDMTKCLHKKHRCDGVNDCPDGSDETFCSSLVVPNVTCVTTFTCRDGSVHPWSRRCDGIKDCYDNEDEQECKVCFNSAHLCPDNTCINYERICDGTVDCSDGSDELGQYCLDHLPCDHLTQWTCADKTCIDSSQHCNGRSDCRDGSDEIYCNCHCEEPFRFRCNNDQCIYGTMKCDGIRQCFDGSDELYCCNSRTEFQCADGTCIDKKLYCNGLYNCPDGSDEPRSCPSICNPNYEIKCPNGRCISKAFLCNGRNDCGDGFDESFHVGCCDPTGSDSIEVCLEPDRILGWPGKFNIYKILNQIHNFITFSYDKLSTYISKDIEY